MDLISVVVPVYRVEPYLDRCVASIVNQTYRNLEIILVDDGSPDRCPAMCDAWAEKDRRIKVIHKANGGLSDARNVGLQLAQGNYVAFIDSDDWIDLRFIEILYKAIVETEAEISACDIRKVYEESEERITSIDAIKVQLSTPREAIQDILYDRRFRTVVWNKLYKREILIDERFETGRCHEDEFFSFRIFDKAKQLAYVDIPLYNYRQRNGSIMTSFSLQHLDMLDAYLNRIELLEKKYSDLASKDKLNFCIACVNLYCEILRKNKDEKQKAKERIHSCRKQICFSKEELSTYSWKDKLYIIFSRNEWIEPVCRIRILRMNKADE